MNKTVLKGLIGTVFIFLLTTITTTGMPANTLAWEILGITTAGTIAGYLAQSVIFPSTSLINNLDSRDFFKGALVTLSNMLSSFGASLLPGAVFSWKALLMSALTVLAAYTLKQLKTTPTGIPPTK